MKYTILFLASLTLYAQDIRVTRMLESKLNVSQRNDACMELRGVKSREVVDAMVRALDSSPVLACAARNLREAGAAGELRQALAGDEPDIRAVAARELGALLLPEMLAPLAQAARDPNMAVATGAFQGLAQYQDRAVLPYLLELVPASGLVGTMALNRAIQFQDPSVAAIARRMLKISDPPMHLVALRAVGELGDDSDLPKLRELAGKSQPLMAGGRGFGFAPAVDLSLAAKNAIRMIESRKHL
jgi:HEAT repeat protein